jgi:hypothetical protein
MAKIPKKSTGFMSTQALAIKPAKQAKIPKTTVTDFAVSVKKQGKKSLAKPLIGK